MLGYGDWTSTLQARTGLAKKNPPRRIRGARAAGKSELLKQLQARTAPDTVKQLREKGHLKSPQDFTALITALGNVFEWRHALAAFEEMRDRGLQPGVFGYGSLSRAFGRRRQWERALQLLEESKDEITADAALYSSVMKACEEDSDRVLSLFEEMQQGIEPDMQSFGIAISSCCQQQNWQQALGLLLQARDRGLQPNAITVSSVMKSLTPEHWARALLLWQDFGEAELQKDAISFTTAIQACASAKLWRFAVNLLEEMHREDLNPGAIPTSVAISACGQVNEWEVALELFRSVRESREALDAVLYNSAVQSCGEGGKWQAAVRLFEEMKEASLVSEKGFSALITALGKSKKWQKALGALESMEPKNVIGFGSAAFAMSMAKKWPHALALLQGLLATDLQPDTIFYNSAISAAERSGKWKVAVALLEDMKAREAAPDVETYAAIIQACVSKKKWQIGLLLMDDMLVEQLEPDTQTLGLLLSECEQHGASESGILKGLADGKSGARSRKQPVPEAEDLDEEEVYEEEEPRATAAGFKPIPMTSSMNARRVKGRAVPGHTPGQLKPLGDDFRPPAPRRPRSGIRVRAGQPYAKELRLLQRVVEEVPPGDPVAICEAIESFGDEVLVRGKAKLWLKIAGGIKTEVLTRAVRGGPLTCGDLQCSVLEVGAYCGYSSTRMALALPGVHIASLEVDPVHVVIARNVVLHGGLSGTIDVWTGHSKDLLPRIMHRYGGDLKFGAVFMDQKGTRYSEDMMKMESEGLLHPGAVVVADNVLKPGAPLFLYQIMNGGRYHAQIASMDEFAMPSEDWMSINVQRREAPENETDAPEDLYQLAKETDRMRERAVGPGRSVTYEEWGEFAQEVKNRLAAANVTLTLDLRPESSRQRDDLFGAKSR